VLVPILEKNNPSGLCAARSNRDSKGILYVAFSPEREDAATRPWRDEIFRK